MPEYTRNNLSYVHTRDVTVDNVENSPEGIILLSRSPTATQPISEAELYARPGYIVGREDSVNGVQFADLVLPRRSSASTTQPVAIKPVESAKHAVREHKVANYLNREGEQLAFRPLGFTRWGNNFSTITEFDQGVVSYDNVLLQETHRPTESEIAESLTVAAQTLIILNDRGLAHGDFQVKNTASDINGRTRIIDLTTMRKLRDAEDVSDDISLYMESLTRFGTKESPVNQQQFDDYFLHKYEKSIPDIFPEQRKLEVGMAITAIRDSLDFLIGPSSN